MTLQHPKEKKFEFPQPKEPYPPSQRSGALVGPSGVGKTTTAIAMLMGPYKDVYSRVYVFSPSCAKGIDPAWDAYRKFVKEQSARRGTNVLGHVGASSFGEADQAALEGECTFESTRQKERLCNMCTGGRLRGPR